MNKYFQIPYAILGLLLLSSTLSLFKKVPDGELMVVRPLGIEIIYSAKSHPEMGLFLLIISFSFILFPVISFWFNRKIRP